MRAKAVMMEIEGKNGYYSRSMQDIKLNSLGDRIRETEQPYKGAFN